MPPVRPTLQGIAAELGVSPSTVSRCLSGTASKYRISLATEAAVRERAAAVGYVPNPLARGLRLKRTLTLGLVVPDVGNPFFAAVSAAVTAEATAAGYSVLLATCGEDPDREAEAVRTLRQRDVDGLVVAPVGVTAAHLAQLATDEVPAVLVDRYVDGVPVAAVASDHRAGAEAAVDHLVGRGHRHIAGLLARPGTAPNDLRLAGFKAAMRRHKLPIAANLLAGDGFDRDAGRRAAETVLATGRPFTAVFAFGILIAVGALDAFRAAGRRVGRDVSLVCFDDHPLAEHLDPPLTVVAQDTDAIGRQAVRRLLAGVTAGQPPAADRLLLPARLIERGSVGDIRKSERRL